MALADPQGALLRWRLVLGPPKKGQAGGAGLWSQAEAALVGDSGLAGVDRALDFLYGEERTAGLGASAPYVLTWLGDLPVAE